MEKDFITILLSCFSSNIHPLVSVSIDNFCLNQLLPWGCQMFIFKVHYFLVVDMLLQDRDFASLSSIYSFIHLDQHALINSYFIQRVIIHYYHPFFIAQIFLDLKTKSTVKLTSVFSWHLPHSCAFPTFLCLLSYAKGCWKLIHTFPGLVLKSVISLKTSGSFEWELIFRKQDLGTHCFWNAIVL